ncbi:hypothetical protein [Vibrio owensii]|uniref:hypothetical protein n=1 Tax=Vibrio owensii TaxID=696485 RepID=UPI0018F18CCA|nr:hypothetical protein [Vibrio owensii]
MPRHQLYPGSLIRDIESNEIGVGELFNAGPGSVRVKIVTPKGKRTIAHGKYTTHTDEIDEATAEWIQKSYTVSLKEINKGKYKVIWPQITTA